MKKNGLKVRKFFFIHNQFYAITYQHKKYEAPSKQQNPPFPYQTQKAGVQRFRNPLDAQRAKNIHEIFWSFSFLYFAVREEGEGPKLILELGN